MHTAQLKTSPRLQRVAALLRDGKPHSTMSIIRGCGVCAVNSIIAELRLNGLTITCCRDSDPERGRRGRRWLYQLVAWHRQATRVNIPATANGPAITMIYA